MTNPMLSQDEIDFDFEPRIVQESQLEVEGNPELSVAQVSSSNEPGSVVQQPPEPSESGNGKGEPEQIALLNLPEWWEEHWRGMPEFKQEDLSPFKTIFVHFESRQDMEKFAKLVGQSIQFTTKSIWYPEAAWDEVAKLRWLSNPDKAREDRMNQKRQELTEILDGE